MSCRILASALALVAGAVFADSERTAEIRVDFDRVIGVVKPVNGTGQGPLIGCDNTELFVYLKEAGVPYCRLHDVGGSYGGNVFVDIPNIFRDFDADETDPKNYDFAFTDVYLKALVDNGVEPFFRLGVTIENAAHRVKPLRIHPPKDYAKWARICEHVIRHYTEGWANGFMWKIEHWEVWNEPENDIERNQMWTGTWADYCGFYETVSKHLKAKFPHLRIGGYAGCGFYAVTKSLSYEANKRRFEYLNDCFTNFVAFARERRCPLDFFSFHCYDDPKNYEVQVRYVRKTLDDAGFKSTIISCNEWLPVSGGLGSAEQAAQIAAMLIAMQNGPTDNGMIYDARCGISYYAPLFDWSGYKEGALDEIALRKGYFALLAFNELRKLGKAVDCFAVGEGVWACAATDGRGVGAILIANVTDGIMPLKIDVGDWRTWTCRLTDESVTERLTVLPRQLTPHSFVLIRTSSGGHQ